MKILIFLIILIAVVNIICILLEHHDKGKTFKNSAPWLNIVASVLATILAIMSLPIEEPTILPVDGMLTEKKPYVRFTNVKTGKLYYSFDGQVEPCDEGFLYKEPFIPDTEGYIFYQIEYLQHRSKVWKEYMTPAAISNDRYGQQEGLNYTSDEGDIVSTDSNGLETSQISQSFMPDEDNSPENITWGWGDSNQGRTIYTIDDINAGLLGDKVTFNSITDSVIGDERNFVAARINDGNHGKDNIWKANLIKVESDNEYFIRLYCHNNSPKGIEKIAHDSMIRFMIPKDSGRTIVVQGMISSSNAYPERYWDSVIFTCEDKFHLEYIPGSALIESNGLVGGANLPDSIVNEWVPIGYDALDGDVPGCYKYASCLTIKVRVVADS